MFLVLHHFVQVQFTVIIKGLVYYYYAFIYVSLIIFYQKILKKVIRKHKVSSHLTSSVKHKTSWGQAPINAFYKGLRGKKDKLNIITSAVANKYAAVGGLDSSLVVVPSYFIYKILLDLLLVIRSIIVEKPFC